MASIITATTTSGLTQSADNSGVLQLASGTGNLVTVPSVTGTAMVSGNMPAFSAYQSGSAQSLSASTQTKIQINTEEFDTASCYDSTTNYRFTPNVAGYYQFIGNIQWGSNNAGTSVTFYKNGSAFKQGTLSSGSTPSGGSATAVIYLNGSTDYVEMYALSAILSNTTSPAQTTVYFQGFLVRAA